MAERIRLSVSRQLDGSGRWTASLISERGEPGRERRVFRAHDLATGRKVAVKANVRPESNRKQFKALGNLYRQTRDCVAPLYIEEDAAFFVTEWVDAPLLSERLADPERPAALARAGQWLARLHAATAGSRPRGSERHVLRLSASSDDSKEREALARLRTRYGGVSLRSGPVAMLHGDFHPGNLFDAGDRIVAFDRKFDRHGIAYADAARFLLTIAHARELAARDARPWAGTADADRRAFFEGFGPLEESRLPLFDLVEDLALVGRWRRSRRLGDMEFEGQMRARCLLGSGDPSARPGRMVLGPAGGPRWTSEAVVMPLRGLFPRIREALSRPSRGRR